MKELCNRRRCAKFAPASEMYNTAGRAQDSASICKVMKSTGVNIESKRGEQRRACYLVGRCSECERAIFSGAQKSSVCRSPISMCVLLFYDPGVDCPAADPLCVSMSELRWMLQNERFGNCFIISAGLVAGEEIHSYISETAFSGSITRGRLENVANLIGKYNFELLLVNFCTT
jgi:hypothetical protein